MLIVTKYGNLQLAPEVSTRIGQLRSTPVNAALSVAISGMVENLVEVTETEAPPILQDADVLLAQVLIEDRGDVDVNTDLLSRLVSAWQTAESSLHKDARVAIRLLDRTMLQVMKSTTRQDFQGWFEEAAARMVDRQGMYLRMYLDRMTEWVQAGEADIGEDPHYVAHVLKSVFERHLKSAIARKRGKAYCQRRLQVARAAVDETFFA